MILINDENFGKAVVASAVTGLSLEEKMIRFNGTDIIWRFEGAEKAKEVFIDLSDKLNEDN